MTINEEDRKQAAAITIAAPSQFLSLFIGREENICRMSLEPPPFQEAARCYVCSCSFNTFRRRHHCRCCGRTLCSEHSSNQMALPQFGIQAIVRVCADCFNNSSRSVNTDSQASSNGVDHVTSQVSKLDIVAETGLNADHTTEGEIATGVECKCGMPLCICKAPEPSISPLPVQVSSTSSSSNLRPKRTETATKSKGYPSNSRPSTLFNPHLDTSATSEINYDVNGEGLREAIKNGDAAAVMKLLSAGVDANYHDKQGMSLLHLAALFNRTEIAFNLMDSGASIEYKNAQGETPLDCAPAMLKYKMEEKIKEGMNVGPESM